MDEDIETLPNHLFISMRHEFKATRVIDYTLSPTTIKIETDINTLDQDTDDYGFRMEVAIAKLNFFVEKVLSNCILIHSDNQWAIDSFVNNGAANAGNMVMLCPEEPTDALLCEILICKFKALAAGAFEFNSIKVESSDSRGMSFVFVGGSPGQSFPEDQEWLTDRNYFSRPWWHRGDASILDVVPNDTDDLNIPPAWAFSLGFIADQMAAPQEQSNVVVHAEFRPKVIEGGKTD